MSTDRGPALHPAAPMPPGWVAVDFLKGSLAGKTRSIRRDALNHGDTYEIVYTGEVYVYDEALHAFILDHVEPR